MKGKIETYEFTEGGAGNQWTWIDGIKYATYWDIRTMDWRVGDTVTFDTYERKFYDNMPGPPVLHAQNIHKVID